MNNNIQLNRRGFFKLSGGLVLSACLLEHVFADDTQIVDVCVYGGNASGVMAAVSAAREGMSVLVVEPSRWLGGMTGGGLIHIDWGRQEAVGGTARGILEAKYNDPQFRDVFARMLKEYSIPVLFEHRVASVQKDGSAIRTMRLDFAPPDETGCPIGQAKKADFRTVAAKVFIDCSYEGDLMARAGVSYTFGRESRETYGESLAGVQQNLAVYDIDPYLEPGNPKSGLIPRVQDIQCGPSGSADKLTMGYGFRWKFSKEADRLPIEAPENYDPKSFELYRRGFQNKVNMFAGHHMKYKLEQWQPTGGHIYAMGAGNLARALWAPTNYGANADYPDGDYATRARIWKEQQDFVRGMTHFLKTDPAVPEKWKTQAMNVGLQAGIFDETKGYPHQLYVREARRMKSNVIITQKDMMGETDPSDSVGLASYGVDEWPYATVPFEGKVALQGGYFSEITLDEVHKGIYKIPYRAITPRQEECSNLLVPVCVSASHIAMTSIRMEPVWMILGESAGVAASMAVKANQSVQVVDYSRLRVRLLELGQRLERPV